MNLHDLIDLPGGREPLMTVGEGNALVRLLELLADDEGEAAEVAGELRVRIGMRLPTPP
ncbi:hypothetical protein [Streptomyces pristinaespiralis]|uniref:hypothetical protein n=1 Tax=Streptomyces pristinaespiralis TaxID=38300 RepID=UPI003838734F